MVGVFRFLLKIPKDIKHVSAGCRGWPCRPHWTVAVRTSEEIVPVKAADSVMGKLRDSIGTAVNEKCAWLGWTDALTGPLIKHVSISVFFKPEHAAVHTRFDSGHLQVDTIDTWG